MAKHPRKKKSGTQDPRPQGRQNAFSGAKLEFLELQKDEFLDSHDRGAFYTRISKEFIQRFGYDLDGGSDGPGPTEIDPMLSPEEQEQESERRAKFYQDLREVSYILNR